MTEIDKIVRACTDSGWSKRRAEIAATRKPPMLSGFDFSGMPAGATITRAEILHSDGRQPTPLVAGGQGRDDWTSVEVDRVGNFTHGFIIGCVIGAALWVALAYAVWPTLVKIF